MSYPMKAFTKANMHKDSGVYWGLATWFGQTFPKGKLLDAGCGGGFLVRHLINQGFDAYGVDSSAATLKIIPEELKNRIKLYDIKQMPYDDKEFDYVLTWQVLEHFTEKDIDKALAELFRVGKTFIFSICLSDRPDPYHTLIRSRAWWIKKFEKFGKKVMNNNEFNSDMLGKNSDELFILDVARVENKRYFDREFFESKTHKKGGRRTEQLDVNIGVSNAIRSLFPRESILEVGCGCGALLKGLERVGVRTTGIEVSQWAVDHAIANQIIQGDVRNLKSLMPENWDIVVCWNVLGYLYPEEVNGALRNLRPLFRKCLVIAIATQEAIQHQKNLAKQGVKGASSYGELGRHCIMPLKWWRAKFRENGFVPDKALEARFAKSGMTPSVLRRA